MHTIYDRPGLSALVEKRLQEDLEEWSKETFDGGFRNHLGASLIGNSCKFYLWATFHWLFKPDFSGRMQRLFNRGHLEETRVIKMLDGLGFKVKFWDWDNYKLISDNNGDLKVEKRSQECDLDKWFDVSMSLQHALDAVALGIELPQTKVSDCNGHFGGSLDLELYFPERFGFDQPVLGEIKTANDLAFKNLLKKRVEMGKPEHYSQMCTYGLKRGYSHALYIAVNKNTDEIYFELVKLKHQVGEAQIYKANEIINSPQPPAKISLNPEFYLCRMCSAKKVCHEKAMVEKNCRSCVYAQPVENKAWFCHSHSAQIPQEIIPKACENWTPYNVNSD